MHACMRPPCLHACMHVRHVIPERETRGKSEKEWMENGENEKGEGGEKERTDRKRGGEAEENREDVASWIRHPIRLQG